MYSFLFVECGQVSPLKRTEAAIIKKLNERAKKDMAKYSDTKRVVVRQIIMVYKPIDNTLYKRDLAVDWKTSVAKIEKQDIQYNNTPFFNDKQWLKEAIESWSAQYNITKIVKSIYNC